ncbi:cyclic AMP-responsive element-binding protein 3-like protein 4 [Denticeps clupeoides]|uniref:Cyclic AMP-responsive element-binding protein 3-like protein 4 n=1 Tax=Denticeps clupeoides TaxID=299321 RepID=A0AAY4E1K9_9TELE|nr:cyclic AMP-responsive element-binding protein 3-like protein 4 [Denticeps clupeoides]
MEAENGGVFLELRDDGGLVEGRVVLEGHHSVYCDTEKALEWTTEPQSVLSDSESEDVLHAINPNEMYSTGHFQEAYSESDTEASEEPHSESSPGTAEPAQDFSGPTVYQVVYDIGSVGNIKSEPEEHNVDVISIELDEWSSQMLVSDSCIVNDFPLASAENAENVHSTSHVCHEHSNSDTTLSYPELHLTEEEQKLLNQEGISLPNNLPLTKAEERVLKKVRRKIRNKLSAQDSRRRKKEYIDGLESRVEACSVQNKELQRTAEQLEKHNVSLMAQLRKLQSLIKQTASKAAQTSTCIMIFFFSLLLIISPSYGPLSRNSPAVEEVYVSPGVISRNILNDHASPLQASEDLDGAEVLLDAAPLSSELTPPEPPDTASPGLLQSPDAAEVDDNGDVQERNISKSTALGDGMIDPLPQGIISASGQKSSASDQAKPAHADEM